MTEHNESGFLTPVQVANRVEISMTTLHRWRKAGIFPEPTSFGPRFIKWRSIDIERWLNSQPQLN